jgi:hypothetical protein
VTKRAFWLVTGTYVLLAIGAIVTLALIANQTNRIESNTDRLEDFAVDVTASLCLQAYAPEGEEQQLIRRFVAGLPIPLTNEVCKDAVALARRQVEE